jgi:hypothetical protein
LAQRLILIKINAAADPFLQFNKKFRFLRRVGGD